ncbi:MAG: ribosylnicotinamide kinase [Vezdaea acicularis]|nr:MAG: ribosylnicotinamide kinase [Vezdaea acicularis]
MPPPSPSPTPSSSLLTTPPAPTIPRTHIIGISGPSSSGKTTLSRLLCSLLRPLVSHIFILHQDDFYKPEEALPYTNGFRDWDCAAAIDVEGLVRALEEVKRGGGSPTWLESKEDQNEVPPAAVSAELVEELRRRVKEGLERRWAPEAQAPLTMGGASGLGTSAAAVSQAGLVSNASPRASHPKEQTICILDGFLLYPPSLSAIHAYLSTSLFLPLTHATMSARRAKRKGYVTLEGFWEDPPGYVDGVVWPNYWGEHKWMFEQRDPGGEAKEEGGQEDLTEVGGEGVVETETGLKIRVKSGEGEMSAVLEWAVGVLLEELWGVGIDEEEEREREGGRDR